MEKIILNLTDLIQVGRTDSISGRRFGEGYANQVKLLENIKLGAHFVLIIPPDKIKAINDSFIKGFFSGIFKEFKSKEIVNSYFTFETDVFYKSLIDKNFSILESIYKS
jgi:hypothetical protein